VSSGFFFFKDWFMHSLPSLLPRHCSWLLAGLFSLLIVGPALGADKPNFLIIMADDMGYSDAGAYGGEINTPHLDQLAEEGLRYTQFYNTGRCWPTRTALLSGYYPQQVGMDPRRGNDLPDWSPLLPEYFAPLGYRAYHSGKWHVWKANRPVADGQFDRSYRMADHDRFFSPKRHLLDDEKLPPVEREDDYYTTTEIASRAIEFLGQHEREHEDKPFLMYVAFTAPHFPLHAPQSDIAKYDGTYDAGWDAIRRQRLKRMKEIGIVGEDVELSPRQPAVTPHWNIGRDRLRKIYGPGEVSAAFPWATLSAKERQFQAKKMQVHAAMIDRMDTEIGRVLDQVEQMDERENTVVIFLSDNGASAEFVHRGDGHDRSAPMGSASSYLCLGPGWSTASNTPMRLHKSWVHEGGINTPLIVNWPAGLKDSVKGELRRTPGHVIDLLPTMLDLAGTSHARQSENEPPLPGKSLVPTLHQTGEVQREAMFFRHDKNRALRVGDWKLVSPRRNREWQLYNLAKDRNELDDLASEKPEKVQQMKQRWQALEDRFLRQWKGEWREELPAQAE
jgi:arylsulfatase